MRLLLLSTISFLFSFGAGTVLAADPSTRSADFTTQAASASLDRLAALQTFVRAGLEGGKFCDSADAAGASAMSQLLEAEIVGRLDARKKEPLFRELFSDGKRIRECAAKCRCGIYLGWLERAEAGGDRSPPSTLAPDVERWKTELRKKAGGDGKLEARRVPACAEANRKWICGGELWKALVSESRAGVESGS